MRAKSAWLCLWLAGLAAQAPGADDKDAERWLKEVHLLMLPDEEAVFRGLTDEADRKEFERIFWARRDPDPATQANELQSAFVRARAKADELFSTPGRKGSESGCGQVLGLLGEPREVEGRELKIRFDSIAVMREGARRPEVWIYRSRPGDAVEFTGGELAIAFDEDCRFAEGGRTLDDLHRAARARIVQPRLAYRKNADGHLARLSDVLREPGASGGALLDSARADFPVALEPKLLLRAGSGQGYAAGLIRADLRGVGEAGSAAMVATVVAQAVEASGRTTPAVERVVRAAVGPDGALTASYGLTLTPGRYTVRVGLVAADKAAVTSTTVEMPDFDAPGLKLGSLIVYPEATATAPADPQAPDAAFSMGALRLHPRAGNVFSKADSLQAVCVLYGGQPDAATGKPSLKARFRFLKDGRPVASGRDETFEAAMAVASVGPVPLASFAPGRYVARVEASDAVSGRLATQETEFEIKP